MRILFMHNNFPGQYRRIYKYLKQFKDYQMAAVTLASNKQPFEIPRINFQPHREAAKETHYTLRNFESAVINGQAAYKALHGMKQRGESPDIVMAHSGWGANLFIKDIFPDAKLLNYFEWYYHCHGGDGEFFRDEPYGPDDEVRIRVKNSVILHDLASMDWGQSPTRFQHSQLPKIFRNRISVLHDGVDTDFFAYDRSKTVTVNGKSFSADDEIITYVARGMEDYRGFRQFMESVSRLMKLRPKLQVLIMGQDRVAYGPQQADGKGLKSWALEKFDYDMNRLHFLGLQSLSTLRDLVQISSAHVYLTAPFVLSWSLMETMATGAVVVGSDTEPLKEMIKDGENGFLVPFFDVDALTDKINYTVENKDKLENIRLAARQTITQNYDVNELLPKYRKLIHQVAGGETPSL